MQVCGRILRMFRLNGGGAGGRPKPQTGVSFRYGHSHFNRAPPPVRKKNWSFIHPDSLSYDTFFTMKRLIERSTRPDEVLRWISQNPSKVCHSHFSVALQRLAQLLQAPHPTTEATHSVTETVPPTAEDTSTVTEEGGAKATDRKWTLEHDEDFVSLCDAIVRDCNKFDNFSLVNCLYAAAALGLSPDSALVQVLETESQSRLQQFNQKDLSMVFSSTMRLHHHHHQNPGPAPEQPQEPVLEQPQDPGREVQPVSQHKAPDVGRFLTEACVLGLERSLERERHPQTLFLLLTYYRGRRRELQSQTEERETDAPTASANQELLLTNRKILRLVKHTLSCVSAVRDQEMALLDEMLAACASETTNKSLELIFSSHLFHQNRQERFICSLAEELQKKADGVSPNTMALIAKYVARHRLRETRLLDTIAHYLVQKAEHLDSKVIQRLVFPFSRMNYRPVNAAEFFCRLEQVLEMKALSSPLATVNILMSLFQLQYFPPTVLSRVFSQGFICNLTNSPYVLIVRRYLSLLDAAVELEFREYSGPRLNQAHRVLMFEQALTADEANRKYSYKGLVAEALRQLIGEQHYKQDQILAPGYYTDFLLWIDSSRRVLPIRSPKQCDPSVATGWQLGSAAAAVTVTTVLEAEPAEEALPVVGGAFLHHMTPFYSTAPTNQDYYRVVLSVNDKWHYCHNSQILVGSRAMRDRHLRLLGYLLLQLPYHELEKLNGIEEVKKYLHQKLLDLPL